MAHNPACGAPDEEFFRTAALCLLRDIATQLGALEVTSVPETSSTATVTQVGDSVVDQEILAANADRKGAYFYNDSTANAFIKLGGAATSLDYTVKVAAQGLWYLPRGYVGAVHAIWDADTAGQMQVTELT